MKKKYRSFIIICVVISAIAWFIKFLSNLTDESLKDLAQNEVRTVAKTPADYSQLSKMDETTSSRTTMSKFRNPILCFDFKKDYSIEIYKIDTLYKPSLTAVIESHNDLHQTYDNPYFGVDNFYPASILYRIGKHEKVINLYLNIYGEQTRTIIKNDTIALYYSKFHSFSIRYGKNSPQDIYAKVDQNALVQNVSIELMFLKRKNRLFLVVVLPENKHTVIQPDFLDKLVALKE